VSWVGWLDCVLSTYQLDVGTHILDGLNLDHDQLVDLWVLVLVEAWHCCVFLCVLTLSLQVISAVRESKLEISISSPTTRAGLKGILRWYHR